MPNAYIDGPNITENPPENVGVGGELISDRRK